MHNQRFQLLFIGVEGQDNELASNRSAIIERFRLSETKARLLFSGEPIVVKRHLSAETAVRYKRIVDGLGGITRIEAMPVNKHLNSSVEVDRRVQTRRLVSDRRSRLRIRSIDTNRRRNKGRRASDYERVS